MKPGKPLVQRMTEPEVGAAGSFGERFAKSDMHVSCANMRIAIIGVNKKNKYFLWGNCGKYKTETANPEDIDIPQDA